ncbi:MAG: AAA domain-containing protein [Verrucomicrobiota bacterium]
MDLSAAATFNDLESLNLVLCDFVHNEAQAQRDQYQRHIQRPIEERIIEERCLADLHISNDMDPEKRSYHFTCTSRLGNTARFREGDRLRLHRGEGLDQGFDVVLVREWDKGGEIRPESGIGELTTLLETETKGWILDEGFFDSEKLLLSGLDSAMKSEDGRERILSLFGGFAQKEMEFGMEDMDDGEAYAEDAGLDFSQSEALSLAISTNHCHLIQGPPGTGKTYVLAQTIATLVERGERVLLTAFTHRAIHHALKTCHRVIRDPDRIAKIGVSVFDPALAPIAQYGSWKKSRIRHQHGGLLVGATPFAAASRRLAEARFDTVVIDEASQMTVPLAILAMMKGKRFLFFGDHQQLPPVLQSIPKHDASSWSVFGSLIRHSDVSTLKTTYRLNSELSQWPSKTFYANELVPEASIADRQLPLPNRKPGHAALSDIASLIFWQVHHEKSRTSSKEEAQAVSAIIVDAVRSGLKASDIGVVTPYRRQAKLIKQKLRQSSLLPDGAADDVVIDTVERFQGQERELVILSLTTSDSSFLDKVADFYLQAQRWNVAITRARSKLIIVGSPLLTNYTPVDPDLDDAAYLVRDLLDQCICLNRKSTNDVSADNT